jgi:hypothetical protein
MPQPVGLKFSPPDTDVAVRKFLEAERRRVREWSSSVVKEVHEQRDGALRRLDEVAGTLGLAAPPKATSTSRARSKKSSKPTAAARAAERRAAVHRFLSERGIPMAFREIQTAMRLSDFSTRSALKRLVEEGMVAQTGVGSSTRYQARMDGSAGNNVSAPAGPSPQIGTAQGSLLAIIGERTLASAEELGQATDLSAEEVERECGTLIREGEIRMARSNGRPVYILNKAA